MATKILIVEDESVIALDLERTLTGLGYQVTGIAANHDQTLASIRRNPPDVVLMDINIGGTLDGIDTAARIRQPVIYLTAYSEDKTLERARQTRPFGFLLKPFSKRELHAAIQIALERHDYEERLKENEIQMATVYSKLALDNVQLKGTANRLLLENQRLDATVDANGAGVITTDRSGNITHLNSAAEAMTGWELNHASGKPISRLLVSVSQNAQLDETALVDQIMAADLAAATTSGLHVLNKDGQLIPVRHRLNFIYDIHQVPAGAIFTFCTTDTPELAADAALQ